MQDLAYGWRRALRAPVSTLAAVACLACSLAAAALVCAAVDGILLRPSAVPAAPRVRLLDLDLTAAGKQQRSTHWSYPAYAAARDALAPDVALHAVTLEPLSLTVGSAETSARLAVEVVSPGYFGALGAAPALGADIDERGGGSDARVWLADSTWRERFGADPAIVGRTITIQGLPFTVAGVARAGFRGLSEEAAAWLPMRASPSVTFARRLEGATSFWHAAFAVAGDDAALAARLPAAGAAVESAIALKLGGAPAHVALASTRWTDRRIDPALTAAITALAICACLLLAIVTLNLVLLCLARLELRRRELGIRSALGASSGRLLAAVAGETLVVFALGVAGAFALTALGLRALDAFDHAIRIGGLRLDAPVVVALLATASAMLVATLGAPALASRRVHVASAIAAHDGVNAGRVQRALAAVQFALATALTIGAALAAGAAWRAVHAPLGFAVDDVLSAQVSIPGALAPADGTAGFLERMRAGMRGIPGAEGAATAACLPVRGGCDSVLIESVPRRDAADWPVALNLVGGDYFDVLKIALRSGRAFDARDVAGAAPVVVLSESAAKRYFPAGDALGQRVNVSIGWPEDNEGAIVVGVVADVFGAELDSTADPMVYAPSAQTAYDDNYLLMRAHEGVAAESLAPAPPRGERVDREHAGAREQRRQRGE